MTKLRISLFHLPIVLVLACCFPCQGQVATGAPPFGSFSEGLDIVNLENLNVHIPISIFNKAGRMMPFVYTYGYDSSIWYPAGLSGNQYWMPVNLWGWASLTQAATGYISYTETIIDCKVGNEEKPGIHEYTNWAYFTPDGTVHPFVGTTTVFEDGCSGTTTHFTSITTDGSGYTLTATGTTGVVTSADGTTNNGMAFSPTTVLTDRNGNEITATSGGISTDTTGLTALKITQGTPPSSTTLTYTAPNGSPATFTVAYKTYTVRTNFGCSGISEFGPLTEYLVSSITLPDTTAYTFSYEPTPGYPSDITGRMTSVTLPTGGEIQYLYTGGSNGITCSDGSAATLQRTTTPGGEWSYSRTLATSPTVVSDPMGNQTVLNFSGIYQTESQTHQGTEDKTLLETVFTCYNGATPNCNNTAITLPITERSTYVQWPGTGGLESRLDTFFNTYGLVTETDEYGYGPGAPGSLMRKTLTTYASLSNGIVDRPATITVKDGTGNVISLTTYCYDEAIPSGTPTCAATGPPTPTSGTPQHVAVTGSRGNVTTIASTVQGSTTLGKTYTFYDTGNVLIATDVNKAQYTYTYGSSSCGNSFPTSVIEPLSLTRSMSWNCTGGVETSVTDENGEMTSVTYSDADFWRPNATTDQESNVTNIKYDGQTSVENSLLYSSGSTTDNLTTVDGLARVQVSQVKESPSSSTYDSVETDYDTLGRPSRTTLPYATTAGLTNSSAPSTTTTYDALSRKSQVTDSEVPTPATLTFVYAQNDTYQTLAPAPTGENAKRKQFEYDALGRLTSVCEVTNATGSGSCAQTSAVTGYWTTYTYDLNNNLTGVTQNAQSSGSQQTRTYAYDDLRRMISETNPESGTTTYSYDTDTTCGTFKGDLVKKIDAVGNTTCFAYDLLHRTTSVTYSGPYSTSTPNKYFVYDAATVNGVAMGNVKTHLAEAYTAASSTGTKFTDIGLSYSVRGEASDAYESTPHSGNYYHTSATYWANGTLNVLNTQYGTNGITGLPMFTYGVDGEGRINTVSASGGQNPVTGTTYSVASLPTQVNLGSSDGDSFTYDPNTNRMTKYTFTVNGQSVVGALTWNPIGTLEGLAITDPFYGAGNQTCSYTHDDMTRIATANCGSAWSQSFSYSADGTGAFGNVSKSGTISFQPTYSYLTNRITQVGSSMATYDANGNAINDTAHTYAWDAAGRPVTVDSVGLTYDALGRMAEQNKSGVYSQIVYTPLGTKFALMNSQTLTRAFAPLPAGSTAVYTPSGLTYYRHPDWVGSSRFASTPTTRAMYFDGAYAPYGEAYSETGTADLSFTGMDQDTAANLYDFPAREYNNIQGRWPSPDPAGLSAASIADPQSFNRYAYVSNSPLGSIDPSGLCPQGCRPVPNLYSSFACQAESICGQDEFDLVDIPVVVGSDGSFGGTYYDAEQGVFVAVTFFPGNAFVLFGGAASSGGSTSWWGAFFKSFFSPSALVKTTYNSFADDSGCDQLMINTLAGDILPIPNRPGVGDVAANAEGGAYLLGMARARAYASAQGLALTSSAYRQLGGQAIRMSEAAAEYTPSILIGYSTVDAVATAGLAAANGTCH